jgi:hypothetical protein
MDDTARLIFRIGFRETAFRIAFLAALKRLAAQLGTEAKKRLDEMEESYVRDVKNITPEGPVPDDLMQSCVEEMIAEMRKMFALARGQIGGG